MSEAPTPPSWIGWIVPFLTVTAALWAIVRRVFVSAVRNEMSSMHEENQTRFREVDDRLGSMANSLSRIEGRLEERWGGER